MTTEAAVLRQLGAPLTIEELGLADLQPGQVCVDIAYSGVCRTQLMEVRGQKGSDRFLPHCLGHEASGVVIEVGHEVRKVAPGDHVVLSWLRGTGAEVRGSRYETRSGDVNAGAITTFMRRALISENRVVRIDPAMPLREAALLGCAMPTGAGAVFNALRAQAGRSIAVFGVGGVGLSAIAAAVSIGLAPIIAIDINQARLEKARAIGATETLDARVSDPIEALHALVPGGVDYSIEAAGSSAMMEAALAAVRAPGGTAVIAGNLASGERMKLDPYELIRGKRLLGTWGGETDPDCDIPRYVEQFLAGTFPLTALISAEYALRDVNRALDELDASVIGRALLAMAS